MRNAAKDGMKLLAAGLLAAAVAGVPVALRAASGHDHGAHAQEAAAAKKGKQGGFVTVVGEVVDLSCYLTHGAKGKKHRKCAKACLLKGLPAGILTDSGKLYLVVESHDKKSQKAYKRVQELGGSRVKAKGKKFMRRGMMALAVTSVAKAK